MLRNICFHGSTTPSVFSCVDREQIDHREDEHPNQINEVPVQPADLDVFMVKLVNASGDYHQVQAPGEDVNIWRPVIPKNVAPNNGVEPGHLSAHSAGS